LTLPNLCRKRRRKVKRNLRDLVKHYIFAGEGKRKLDGFEKFLDTSR
jgi:hypothetical protein